MRGPLLIPLIIACALFMENLDFTIIATALPAIARDIGADPIHLKLGVTSYLLSLAVFTPASGWIAGICSTPPCELAGTRLCMVA